VCSIKITEDEKSHFLGFELEVYIDVQPKSTHEQFWIATEKLLRVFDHGDCLKVPYGTTIILFYFILATSSAFDFAKNANLKQKIC
jgi:hypothetical protein